MKIMKLTNSICLLTSLSAVAFSATSQDVSDSIYRSMNDLDVPSLTIQRSSSAALPSRVDNSESSYFRPIFNQVGNSCMIASNMGYIMTYEKNILDQTMANVPENQIAYRYIFHFINNGADAFTNGWDALTLQKEIGAASVADFGDGSDYTHWMSGYDKYYRSMKTRYTGYYRISGLDESAVVQMKQYLFDAGSGRTPGGLIAAGGYMGNGLTIQPIPSGTPEAGKSIITKFANLDGGHAMTWVGYDDSVRVDINSDGKYTNNIDITYDGVVDIRDWEIGAFIVANSWGDSWQNKGEIYVMYRLAGFDEGWQGGMSGWRDVMQFKNVQPKLTAKFLITSASRNSLRIAVGISSDTASQAPQYLKSFQALTNTGGNFPMQGGTGSQDDSIEMGLDISSLLDSIPVSKSYKLFLVTANSGWQSSTVNRFSVIRYNSSTDTTEYISDSSDIAIGSMTFVPVVVKEKTGQTGIVQSIKTNQPTAIITAGKLNISNEWIGGSVKMYDLHGRLLLNIPALNSRTIALPESAKVGLLRLEKNGISSTMKFIN